MKKLPLYIFYSALCLILLFHFMIGISVSSEGNSISVAGADISHWLKYDGGYDYYGRLDKEMNIELMVQMPSDGSVEKMLKDVAVCYSGNHVLRQVDDMANNEKFYFVGLQADEDAPGNYGCYYVFFFDDFTKATSNASDYIDEFNIEKPDEWVLNDYWYPVENPQEVKQFFIDKGRYQ